jgi:hypothetical protein
MAGETQCGTQLFASHVLGQTLAIFRYRIAELHRAAQSCTERDTHAHGKDATAVACGPSNRVIQFQRRGHCAPDDRRGEVSGRAQCHRLRRLL